MATSRKLLLGLLALAFACQSELTRWDAGGGEDVALADVAGAPETLAPPYTMVTECFQCHLASALFQPQAGAAHAPGTWMALAGEGLLRYDPCTPLDADLHFELRWPRRGHHPEMPLSACGDCHPVRADGVGHGVIQYDASAREAAFAPGGVGCAATCHDWLGERWYPTPPYLAGEGLPLDVASRPEALLAASPDSGHGRLWREGFAAEVHSDETGMGLVGAGCGGCHNAPADRHGEIPACTGCHVFGGLGSALHRAHTAAIAREQARLDPALAEADRCLYCHDRNEVDAQEPDERWRAACYNCHLSGHQPMNAEGQPHFW